MKEANPICEPVYTVNEVAQARRWSRDTVSRRFENIPGVFDEGQPERLHKRRYHQLRIPRSVLMKYLDDHRLGATS